MLRFLRYRFVDDCITIYVSSSYQLIPDSFLCGKLPKRTHNIGLIAVSLSWPAAFRLRLCLVPHASSSPLLVKSTSQRQTSLSIQVTQHVDDDQMTWQPEAHFHTGFLRKKLKVLVDFKEWYSTSNKVKNKHLTWPLLKETCSKLVYKPSFGWVGNQPSVKARLSSTSKKNKAFFGFASARQHAIPMMCTICRDV